MAKDFLIEILTEELPAKHLSALSKAFATNITSELRKLNLSFSDSVEYATPRRIAVKVKSLDEKQKDQLVERRGPAVDAAFNDDGAPTPAAMGFAKSCGVDVEQLDRQQTDKGEYLFYTLKQRGKQTVDLLQAVVERALKQLPLPKTMYWGCGEHHFLRPVHNILAMFDDALVPLELFGLKSNKITLGHRFHSSESIELNHVNDYEKKLEAAYVIASHLKRKSIIQQEVERIAKDNQAEAIMPDGLLEEVTALVEWPVAICGEFDEHFLSVPHEVLTLSMQVNQKYFGLKNKEGLLNKFITISNIDTKNPERVAEGNRRVITARFSDAAFFFEMDKKATLASRAEALSKVVFEKTLGTLFDKTQRVMVLSQRLAHDFAANEKHVERAAYLSKTDLLTNMVGEFPELQGVMGKYYALHDSEPPVVANALLEQYLPRFAGDVLPENSVSQCLAVADRLDTIVGIIGINKTPTGDKDPFALRRAALGLLRIVVENALSIDLPAYINSAIDQFGGKLTNDNTALQALHFIQERMKFWLLDQGVPNHVYQSVAALSFKCPLDFKKRIDAVQHFLNQPACDSLAAANKRVANILKKSATEKALPAVDETLFDNEQEKILSKALTDVQYQVDEALRVDDYQGALQALAELKVPVDEFFDKVMVMDEDQAKRLNRLALLKQLRDCFLLVADISAL